MVYFVLLLGYVLEALNEYERPVHEPHIIFGDLTCFFLVEDNFGVVIGHASGGPHDGRAELVQHHLGETRFVLLDFLGMGHPSNTFCDLLHFHLDNLVL